MQLASDNSWARHRLNDLSWRSWWIILCTLERRMTVSCEISWADRCFFGLSSWLSTRLSSVTRQTRSTAAQLPDNFTCFADFFSRLSMLWSFQPLSGNSLTGFVHHTALTDRFLIRIPSSCKIFMILFNFYCISAYWRAICDLSNTAISNDLERTVTLFFKVIPLCDAKYLTNSYRYCHSY